METAMDGGKCADRARVGRLERWIASGHKLRPFEVEIEVVERMKMLNIE